MTKISRKNILKVVSVVLTAGVFVFAYLYARRLLSDFELETIDLNYAYLALACVLFIIFYIILGWHWFSVCRVVQGDVSKKQILVFFASQPYKYLPTSLFTFSFRAKFAADAGLRLKPSSKAQLQENANILLSGAVLGSVALVLQQNMWFLLLVFLAGVGVYSLLPKKLNISLRRVSFSASKYMLTINFMIAFVGWVIAGFSFYFAGKAFDSDISLLTAIAANSFAYVAGILAVFAPGGVGVRELFYGAFSVANPLIIGWRLLTFFADLALGVVAQIILRKQRST